MRNIRVFVSSPGDAAHERGRVERVVERLNGQFSNAARLSTIRWETGFYAAHVTFQAQIPEAADCDIVIGIFRARLGTELPAGFPPMPDGEPYPSGTAYELLSAIAARKSKDLPDVYVFRHPHPPSVTLDDPEGEAATRDQWTRLKGFFERWFETSEGQFKAAFHTYGDTDQFEEQVEALLRGWLEEHVLGARAIAWPIALKGSPFRGLEAFGAKHAEVFFGRTRDTEKAIDALKDVAARRERLSFLLLVGPSGAGKSSLARAGLLPRLTTPGVVPEVAVWRTAVLRPGEVMGGPFMSLATRLFDDDADIPEAEAGRPKALPELGEGDHASPRELVALLGHADETATRPILRALDRIAVAEQAEAVSGKPMEARLLLVVDQIDELLGGDVEPDERARFGRLLCKLAETARVWIVGTLRADLYEPFSRDSALLDLKRRGASYDLEPPGASALEEIVRKPAEAAGLTYEERVLPDGARQRLDERLIADAGRPDMLPLMQFTLSQLYEECETRSDMIFLTHGAYDRLGGLDGAIAREAERALDGLGDVERARLPRLLRLLVVDTEEKEVKGAGSFAIRSVAYAEATHDAPSKALVDALIVARILLGEGYTQGDVTVRSVRLAHQRVLEAWPRARDTVAANTTFFRVSREVEHAEARWLAKGKPTDLLLQRGVALSEAEEIAAEFGDEIPKRAYDFIHASTRRARRTQRLAIGAAAVFALVATGAATAGIFAYQAEQRAIAARDTAKRDSTIVQIAIERMIKTGKRSDALAVYERRLAIARTLAKRAPDNVEWLGDVAASLARIGDMRRAAADRVGALVAFEESLAIRRALVKRDPGNVEWQSQVAASLNAIGDMRAAAGDRASALQVFEESLGISRSLARLEPKVLIWQAGVSESLVKIGDIHADSGNRRSALAAYDESLSIARTLTRHDPRDMDWQSSVAVSLERVGDMYRASGDRLGALAAYEESLAIRRALINRAPDMDVWSNLAFSLTRIAEMRADSGDQLGAATAYEESLAVRRALVKGDPDNVDWQSEMSLSLVLIGDMRQASDDRLGAIAAYEESLTIRRDLAKRDVDNMDWQRDVSASLARIGGMRSRSGDQQGALAANEESLAILRTLIQRDPNNSDWQRDMSLSLTEIGRIRAVLGDQVTAMLAYEEGLEITRALVRRDPDNADWLRDLSVSLVRIGDLRVASGGRAGALTFYEEGLAIRRTLVRRDSGKSDWQIDLVLSLTKTAPFRADPSAELNEALVILGALNERNQLTAAQRGRITYVEGEIAKIAPR